MLNEYTDSLDDTLPESSKMDGNNIEKQSEDENEASSSMEEDDRISDNTSTTANASTSDNNPFISIIDRKLGTKEQQQASNNNNLGISSSNSTTTSARGFQSEFVTPGNNRITPDDFMNTLIGFNNMYLAHEISINPDFKLERFVAPPDSLEYRIQHQLTRAFWDVFEEQLNAQPPNYSQALSIFEEMKIMLLSLLMPHNHAMRQRINEVLDVELIRQQVQHDALDFSKYAEFIIGILSQLCAPSRDDEITVLKTLVKPTEIFQGILELMEKMKLDMANFYVAQFRPEISRNCLQYERKKFSDFLNLEFRLQEDGLRSTRKWVLKHKTDNHDTNVMIKAFIEILGWTEENTEWPETLVLDATRLRKIALGVKRLGIVGGIILTVETLTQTLLGVANPQLRPLLKTQLESLISDEDMVNDAKLMESLDRVAEQVVKVVGDILLAEKTRNLEDSEKESIRHAIKDLVRPDHKIRSLLVRRTMEYSESCIINGKNNQIPSGLCCIGPEITILIKEYFRIVLYNRAVFDCVYNILLEDETLGSTVEKILKALSHKEQGK